MFCSLYRGTVYAYNGIRGRERLYRRCGALDLTSVRLNKALGFYWIYGSHCVVQFEYLT